MKRLSPVFAIIALILAVLTLSNCTTTPKETPSEAPVEVTTQEEEAAAEVEAEQETEPEAAAEPESVSELEGSTWIVETIHGNAVVAAEEPPTIEFLANGRLAGNASCNRILGSYEEGTAPGELVLNLAGTTMKMCPDEVMKQEQDILGLLPEINAYELDGDALHLKSRGEVVVVARRA